MFFPIPPLAVEDKLTPRCPKLGSVFFLNGEGKDVFLEKFGQIQVRAMKICEI